MFNATMFKVHLWQVALLSAVPARSHTLKREEHAPVPRYKQLFTHRKSAVLVM
jgi:hypothetical protein